MDPNDPTWWPASPWAWCWAPCWSAAAVDLVVGLGPARRSRSAEGQAVLRAARHRPGHRGRRRRLAAAQGMLSSIGASGAVELLVIGACTWLAYDIMRQSRGIEA
ncbi:MAG: hypothetical protein ACLSVD_03060 [Eggerthellaceae bacterium]